MLIRGVDVTGRKLKVLVNEITLIALMSWHPSAFRNKLVCESSLLRVNRTK